jgi:F-type H+-transporting ATPase subunit a
MQTVHISIRAEQIFEFLGIPITNSTLTTWLVMLLLIIFSFIVYRKISFMPSSLQVIAEMLIGGIYNFFETVTREKTKIFFPILATLFIFIIMLNWFGLLPGVGTIGLNEIEGGQKVFVPLFRAGSADINTTLALALIAVFLIQYYGIKTLGLDYLGRFFNFKNPIYFFVGLLELVLEFAKILSFSFRLFGNIFAGEVLLTVIAFLMPILAPIPFLGLELFVGFIQALVFSMLTAVFLSLATVKMEH